MLIFPLQMDNFRELKILKFFQRNQCVPSKFLGCTFGKDPKSGPTTIMLWVAKIAHWYDRKPALAMGRQSYENNLQMHKELTFVAG